MPTVIVPPLLTIVPVEVGLLPRGMVQSLPTLIVCVGPGLAKVMVLNVTPPHARVLSAAA